MNASRKALILMRLTLGLLLASVAALNCTMADDGKEKVSGLIASYAPSGLTYSPADIVVYRDTSLSPQRPTLAAKLSLESCVSNPPLPNGLALDSVSCTISGTPLVSQAKTSYTITAMNELGSTTAEISIEIRIPPPSNLAYPSSPYTFSNIANTGKITPTFDGEVTSCSSSPALPDGLSIVPTNCEISGTPTTYQNEVTYTITASNSMGSTSTTISIRIDECYQRGCLRDNMNGTVTFTGSSGDYAGMNVIFMKCTVGQVWNSATNDCTGTGSAPGYGAAVYTISNPCSSLSFAGKGAGSWRVATGLELASIVQCGNKANIVYGNNGCGIGNGTAPGVSTLFPNTQTVGGYDSEPAGRYWASDAINISGTWYTYWVSYALDSSNRLAKWSAAAYSPQRKYYMRCATAGP